MRKLKKKYGVGVIGAGYVGTDKQYQSMGTKHVRDYKTVPAVDVKCCCGLDAEDGPRLSAEFGPVDYTTDYRELLDREDIQVVSIATPDHLHFEHAAAAIRARKHVLCEKPMVTTVEDAIELVRLTREYHVKFAVGNINRYVAAFIICDKLVRDGKIGRLHYVESNYWHHMEEQYQETPWRVDKQNPQNFWIGGAVHPMDLVINFAGEVEEVFLMQNKLGGELCGFPLPDHFEALVRFKSGAIGKVGAGAGTFYRPHCMVDVKAFGSAGSILCDAHGADVLTITEGGFPQQTDWARIPVKSRDIHAAKPVREEIVSLLEAIEYDDKPFVDVVDGARTIAALVAGLQSVETGKPVKPKNIL